MSLRLTLALITMATFSAFLAGYAQDRGLDRDLRQAAAARLERSAHAGKRVVAEHLDSLGERYRTIARNPRIRATLELNDRPTLNFLAQELVERHAATAIIFSTSTGSTAGVAGQRELGALLPEVAGQFLRADPASGQLYASVRVPIEAQGVLLGSLVAFEVVDPRRLASWSELCGAQISAVFDGDIQLENDESLRHRILDLEGADLIATSGLEAERAAVYHARIELIRAGGLALAISILACIALARSLVRPISEIQAAIERIRKGEPGTPLASSRTDEIGDVARGIDRMATELVASRAELDFRIGELDRSETHLANAQRLARLGSFEVDLQTGELSGSQELFALIGIDPSTVGGKVSVEVLIQSIHEADRDQVRETVADCVRTGLSARVDHRVVVGENERVMHTQINVLCDEAGKPVRLEGTLQDVTERRRAEKQIQFLAHHDNLTGLGNRRHFAERLEIAIGQSRRRGTGIGVFLLDLDHFKRINDTLGHSVGDELLRGAADRIIACLRPGDEISRAIDESHENFSISRLGGDEFTVMLTDQRDPSALAPVAQRILDALARPFIVGTHELVVSASIGIATWPHDGPDVDTLLRNADSAMYHAKSNGRNNYKYYEESMNAAAQDRLELETRLRRAIDTETIEVHYQPRVEIETGRVCGYEALTRWRDPELGQVSPAHFIPIAEQTGLIVPLGRYVLRSACRQAAEWERSDMRFDGCISVNVSSSQFKLVDVAREVADALAEYRVNPLRLEIEVTESIVLHNEEQVIQTLRAIRDMGVKIALDDFGTGYSSLSYLRRLPIDVLKIDMAFVRGIARSREDAALTRAIIAMAAALDLRVVAEGVESVEQRELLREWRCAEMQGFLESPALPSGEVAAWVAGRSS